MTTKVKDTLTNKEKEVSVKDLKQAIPKHCFVKDEKKFLLNLLKDFLLALSLHLAAQFIPQTVYFIPVWIAYAIAAGTVWTGIWVLGHECGHYSFSEKKWKCELLGYVLHTSMCVPFYSWQRSHHVHHLFVNHIDIGEGHVPTKIKEYRTSAQYKLAQLIGDDAFAILKLNILIFLSWFIYTILGKSGGPARGFTSHYFVPNKLVKMNMFWKAQISTLGVLSMLYGLYRWAQITSWVNVWCYYLGPYFVVNGWLISYTFLHHAGLDVPHYDDRQWSWLLGAVQTIDRGYPAFINRLHHNIGSTHVAHHLFSEMPHYHAVEATEIIKPILGEHYLYRDSVVRDFHQTVKYGQCITHIGDGKWMLNKDDQYDNFCQDDWTSSE